MEKKLIEKFDMGVNFDGLIVLLAQHLYSDPHVFLRELIQNAHDAIQKRKAIDRDLSGKIEIRFNESESTIICSDNGIGMVKDEIKNHLATIGDSGTKIQKLSKDDIDLAGNLIGQFGIGLLAAFIVAKKVVVRTKKIQTTESFEWHNSGSLRCELFDDDLEHYGTEIIIYLKTILR